MQSRLTKNVTSAISRQELLTDENIGQMTDAEQVDSGNILKRVRKAAHAFPSRGKPAQAAE